MRVAIVNTYDGVGGAAKAAYRLHRGLRAGGIDSIFVAAEKHTSDPNVLHIRPDDGAPRERARAMSALILEEFRPYPRLAEDAYPLFHSDRAGLGEALVCKFPAVDVVNLHWTRGLVDWQLFFASRMPSQPVVFTLHDAQPFTGGCHYCGGCIRFRDACGYCPWLASNRPDDLSAQVLVRKHEAMARHAPRALHVVSPSRWLAAEARSSSLFESLPVSVIPNGLDTMLFQPRDRHAVRAGLDIPQDAVVLLFVAQHLSDPRKGLPSVERALRLLPKSSQPLLVTVGNCTDVPGHLARRDLGPIADDERMAEIYSMADFLVAPSLEDNFPNTVAEAMACGVPVLAYPVGGLPDLVRNGATGFLACAPNAEALAECLGVALACPADRQRAMGAAARRLIEEECSLAVQASRYSDLFCSMLNEST